MRPLRDLMLDANAQIMLLACMRLGLRNEAGTFTKEEAFDEAMRIRCEEELTPAQVRDEMIKLGMEKMRRESARAEGPEFSDWRKR